MGGGGVCLFFLFFETINDSKIHPWILVLVRVYVFTSLYHILQGDYVLCRMFHKPDEKPDSSKYDEVEPTGSSPSINKSSPDETSKDLFQEPPVLDMPICKVPGDVKECLTYESENTTPDILAPVKGYGSGVFHSAEETTPEVRDLLFHLC